MTRATRVLLTLLVCFSLLAATTVGVTIAAVYREGTIAVAVSEDAGDEIRIAAPAGLVRLAIWFTPASVFEPALVDEVEALLPAARAGWRELLRAPDFVLAEIRDGRDHVRIEKRGDEILIGVISDGSTVRVALPLRTFGSLLAKLERAGARRA